MTPAQLEKEAHMAPSALAKGRKRASFKTGYAEFQELYRTDERLQRFQLPLDFTNFNTPEYWDLDPGPLCCGCMLIA